jgi:hypothetical protein
MRNVDDDKDEYIANWRVLLRELLGWTEQEIDNWIQWASDVFQLSDPNSWTYHQLPAYTVIPFVIRNIMGDGLSDDDFRGLQNDIRRAFDYGRPDFTQVTDWSPYKTQLADIFSDFRKRHAPASAGERELALSTRR